MNLQSIEAVPVVGTMILPQAEYEALRDLEGEFDVVAYQVVYDVEKLSYIPVTQLLATREQAQALLSMVQEQAVDKPQVKNLRISKQTFFYTSLNDAGRQEILAKIVQAGGES